MDSTCNRTPWVDIAWLVGWGLFSSLWCLTASVRLSATWDKPTYLLAGLQCWRTGSVATITCHGTMPLPVETTTLPLYLYERWHGQPLDVDAELAHILPWARVGTLVFWWLLLIHGGLLARHLGGPWAGRLAVALLACEPTLLAHAGLATTDLCLAACLVALVYHFHAHRDAGWPRRVGLPAVCLAASLLAKVSSLAYGPLCLMAVEISRLPRLWTVESQGTGKPGEVSLLRRIGKVLRPGCADGDQIVLLGLVLACLFCHDGYGLSLKRSGVVSSFLFQFQHNQTGQGSACYRLRLGPDPYWFHFPLVLSMKLGLPLLGLAGALLLWRPRHLVNLAFLSAGMILLLSLTSRIQIGVRLILPVIALVIVGLAAAAGLLGAELHGWRRRLVGSGLGACLLWMAVAAGQSWPHGLCYTNELWGGSERGYLVMGDSNYDWGQGLEDLDRWRRARGLERMDIGYFGQGLVLTGRAYDLVPELTSLPVEGPKGLRRRERGHFLAMSTTLLYGQGDFPAAVYLRGLTPVGRTPTFFIYDFTETPPAPGFVQKEPDQLQGPVKARSVSDG